MSARPKADVRLRPGRLADLDALMALEQAAFITDHISRRSFRRFLASRSAARIVAEHDGRPAGYALALFRSSSRLARLYSIAVAANAGGRGIGSMLLHALERRARRRGCRAMRLEVHTENAAAIARYRK